MAWQRWTLHDPLLAETWTFAVNPSEGGEPTRKKTVTSQSTTAPDGRTILTEGLSPPLEISWKGVILTLAERDIFISWFNKQYQVLLTNDIGEQYWIYIDQFNPTRKRVITREAKYEYDIHAFVLDIPD